MSDNKSKDSGSTAKPSGDSFDDLEDAFFASGDASGFWETADPSQLDDESAEAESPATARDDEAEAAAEAEIAGQAGHGDIDDPAPEAGEAGEEAAEAAEAPSDQMQRRGLTLRRE